MSDLVLSLRHQNPRTRNTNIGPVDYGIVLIGAPPAHRLTFLPYHTGHELCVLKTSFCSFPRLCFHLPVTRTLLNVESIKTLLSLFWKVCRHRLHQLLPPGGKRDKERGNVIRFNPPSSRSGSRCLANVAAASYLQSLRTSKHQRWKINTRETGAGCRDFHILFVFV